MVYLLHKHRMTYKAMYCLNGIPMCRVCATDDTVFARVYKMLLCHERYLQSSEN